MLRKNDWEDESSKRTNQQRSLCGVAITYHCVVGGGGGTRSKMK